MKIELKVVDNTCGPCTLCCKVFNIPELDKPQDVWCPNARKSWGCTIYEDRPSMCREFECMWLAENLDSKWRPDRIHGVITSTEDGKHFQLHEDPGYRGHARRALKFLIDAIVEDGKTYVVVICGDERVFMGDPRLLDGRTATPILEAIDRIRRFL